MQVKIAHESPVSSISVVQKCTDFDFVIAHHALENPEYARLYRERPLGRTLILDNSSFELVYPLSPKEILGAAERVGANILIPPDHMGDFQRTKQLLKNFIEQVKGRYAYQIAPVVVGKDPAELARCYDYYTTIPEIDMYCLAFGTERAAALTLVRRIDNDKPHHLLGFSTRKEFELCRDRLQLTLLSIDTSKPVNATYHNEPVRDLGRGSYKRPALDTKLNEELLVKNIATFKRWLTDENP